MFKEKSILVQSECTENKAVKVTQKSSESNRKINRKQTKTKRKEINFFNALAEQFGKTFISHINSITFK